MYFSPPRHEAVAAAKILNDPAYLAEWKAEIKAVADRIIEIRTVINNKLNEFGNSSTF